MNYELVSENFSGPIEKLLELIEDRKLQITEVSLSAVTEDFLKYLDQIRTASEDTSRSAADRQRLRLVVDFLSVASKLILIKSRSLLPDTTFTPEEEESIADLELRLKLFRALRPAMKRLDTAWATSSHLYARPYFLTLPPSVFAGWGENAFFHPGDNVNPVALQNALSGILQSFHSLFQEEELIREKLVSLEEEMGRVVERISAGAATLRSLANGGSRQQIIVLFLALLHLAREQAVQLVQDSPFSDILVGQKNSETA